MSYSGIPGVVIRLVSSLHPEQVISDDGLRVFSNGKAPICAVVERDAYRGLLNSPVLAELVYLGAHRQTTSRSRMRKYLMPYRRDLWCTPQQASRSIVHRETHINASREKGTKALYAPSAVSPPSASRLCVHPAARQPLQRTLGCSLQGVQGPSPRAPVYLP